MSGRKYSFFETESAVYHIFNGKHYVHLKAWDGVPGFRYHEAEISSSSYATAYRGEK